jgi:hypothetical protein
MPLLISDSKICQNKFAVKGAFFVKKQKKAESTAA